jgi:sulfoxide reductase heme-binding subunit YedZ
MKKAALFAVCLAPVLWMAWGVYRGDVGPNPVEYITHGTGDWTLRFLLITLAVTPVRRLAGLPWLIRYRRMLGLFAFFYGCLHFAIYLWLDKVFDWQEIWKDIYKRPFITAGFTAFALMVPLAITSTKGWVRRLGGKRWALLHRLVYVSGVAAVVHYYWLVKSDIREPLLYGVILMILLMYRARPILARAFVRNPATR